jgi:hypothetical protein
MKQFFNRIGAMLLLSALSVCRSIGAGVYSLGEYAYVQLFRSMQRQGLVLGISAQEFMANRVTNPNQSEIIRGRLYDYQLYATAGVTQMTFFSQPIGSGITSAVGAVVGSAKTYFDTNMNVGGTLPSGMSYLIESIEVLFLPGSVSTANTYTMATIGIFNATAAAALWGASNDVNSFYQSGMLELNILQKNYLRETPLMCFPPKCMTSSEASAASNSATTAQVGTQLAKAVGRPYYIEPQITLLPAVNFEVLLKWPAAVATPSGFNARVGVILDGGFMRASQ